jgi:uncharacterized membrane protein
MVADPLKTSLACLNVTWLVIALYVYEKHVKLHTTAVADVAAVVSLTLLAVSISVNWSRGKTWRGKL